MFECVKGEHSFWLARRTQHITGVEDDKVWQEEIIVKILNRFKSVSFMLKVT